jgi:hypothetical protein
MLRFILGGAAAALVLANLHTARADIFESVNAPGLCLNVTSGGVSILPCNGGPTQDLAVQALPSLNDGYLIAAGAGCLKMAGENRSPKLSLCDSMKFTFFEFLDDGSIAGDGLCLDVKGGGRKSGTTVIGYRCNGRPNQRWLRTETGTTLEDSTSGTVDNMSEGVLAANSAPNLCLDTNANGFLELQPCAMAMTVTLSAGQALTWIKTDSGECVSPYGSQGEQLSVEPCGINSIEWGLTSNGLLRNSDGLCADVEGNRRNPGTRVIFFKCSGKQNQRFTFISNE